MAVPTRIRRPPIRLRPAPPLDPPFIDESADFVVHPGVQLALDLTGPTDAPATRRPAEAPQPPGTPQVGLPAGAVLPAPGLAGASPEARRAAQRFLSAAVEIINGFRPVPHARRLAAPAQAAVICAQLTVAAQRARTPDRPPGAVRNRGPRPTAPPTGRGDRRGELLRVRQLRICEPTAGVVETAAVLGTTSRSWALAFRLERQADAWLSTAVYLV
ncbi:Rv3235 family protein [Solwaraspora sp. WMMA2056]|uniref:Rv3235 family protein n=1 Tax=Solwaraspora sp. WMMA2056 TaxID=3015161 RepID=UPI00259BCDF6|nr:Rv3235 family protein [Solwaraspora sp. WMMA2056]WJK42541.1 Rv3235 family protein [Solwaraspora sp. WMMA2056]